MIFMRIIRTALLFVATLSGCSTHLKNLPRTGGRQGACNAQSSVATSTLNLSSTTTLHQIPWTPGKSFYITTWPKNAPPSITSKHSHPVEAYAWDFGGMAFKEPIVASVGGTVRRARNGVNSHYCAKGENISIDENGDGEFEKQTNTPGDASIVNLVVIYWDDNSGRESLYLHFTELAAGIRVGAKVKRGQVIGYAGNTGHSCGLHLHYQVQSGAKSATDTASSWWLQSIFVPFTGISESEQLRATRLTAVALDGGETKEEVVTTPEEQEPSPSNTTSTTGNANQNKTENVIEKMENPEPTSTSQEGGCQ